MYNNLLFLRTTNEPFKNPLLSHCKKKYILFYYVMCGYLINKNTQCKKNLMQYNNNVQILTSRHDNVGGNMRYSKLYCEGEGEKKNKGRR